MGRITIISLALAFMLTLLAGCGRKELTGKPAMRDLEMRLDQPGQSLVAIGNMANELGERYEDDGNLEKARSRYAKAIWAYELEYYLTGEEPLLLDDARESLARIKRNRK